MEPTLKKKSEVAQVFIVKLRFQNIVFMYKITHMQFSVRWNELNSPMTLKNLSYNRLLWRVLCYNNIKLKSIKDAKSYKIIFHNMFGTKSSRSLKFWKFCKLRNEKY